MTAKQALRAHINAMHSRKPPASYTYAQLQAWHATMHHRLSPNHYHAGANTGPDERPAGWYTGEDAILNNEQMPESIAKHLRNDSANNEQMPESIAKHLRFLGF